MTRHRTPTPTHLGRAFASAEGLAAGMTKRELRHPALLRPTRGLRVTAPPDCLLEQATALACVLETPWAFSHITAARLCGLPVPRVWVASEPLHVSVPTDVNRVRRPGVVGHRGLESRLVGRVGSLPVTSPVATWVDLAGLGRGRGRFTVDDLVVVGDAILTGWPELHPDLAAELERRRGARGVLALREALALVRAGSASAMESRARIGFVRAGLPEPELNQNVCDHAGRWLARVDMLWRDKRVIVEYEGDQHRTDRVQWQRDIERTRRLEAAGWKVIRVSAADLADPTRWAELVTLLRLLLSA